MRTTVDIEDDLLQAARELASNRAITIGKVISDLLRKALAAPAARTVRNGVRILPRRASKAPKPTMELVNRLRG